MIRHPIEVDESDTSGLTVSFPFGVGEFKLLPEDGLIVAHRKLEGGRRISLIVEKIENYQLPYIMEDVQFQSGELTLKGTVYLPKGHPKPRGGLVILHGSTAGGRSSWEYRSWADYYARLGIVVLIYDKRDYDDVYPDLKDLASDAKSALTWLKDQPQVLENSVGFFGGSQAGWLAAAVAADNEATPDFVIISGWPAVTPLHQERQSIELKLRNSELSGDQVNDAFAYMNLYFFHAQSGLLWQELQSAANDAADQPWAKYVPIPKSKSEMLWWSRNHGFPTDLHLRHLKCPVLACFGQNDQVVPPARNAEVLREILTRSGNQDVTIRIFDDGDHRLELPFVVGPEQIRWPQLSPDYLHTLESWLQARNFLD